MFFAGVVICFYLVFSVLVLGLALPAILVLQIRHLRLVIDVIYGGFTGCVIQYYSHQWVGCMKTSRDRYNLGLCFGYYQLELIIV